MPNAGYHFVDWSDGVLTASRARTRNVHANISVTANFAINTYTLTYTAGANGTITGTSPQTVNHGASGTAVTAVAERRLPLRRTGATASDRQPATDTNVHANITVTANFAINTYTLTYTAGRERLDHGHLAADGELRRQRHAVTAVPNAGYHFVVLE